MGGRGSSGKSLCLKVGNEISSDLIKEWFHEKMNIPNYAIFPRYAKIVGETEGGEE